MATQAREKTVKTVGKGFLPDAEGLGGVMGSELEVVGLEKLEFVYAPPDIGRDVDEPPLVGGLSLT